MRKSPGGPWLETISMFVVRYSSHGKKQKCRHTENSRHLCVCVCMCLQRIGKFISPRTKVVANPGKKSCKVLSFIIFILGSVTYKTPAMLPTKVSAVVFIQPSSLGNKMLVDPTPRHCPLKGWLCSLGDTPLFSLE